MHISSVIKISFCRISFSGHQNKFCACLDSIYRSRVMCKNCSDIRWHRLNSNQSKTNCPKNLNSDGLIVREMGPWPECIFRSLLQFLVYLRLNKRLSKQSRSRWFETPSRSLWRHCNGVRHRMMHRCDKHRNGYVQFTPSNTLKNNAFINAFWAKFY